jgi:perosamine synthetase
VSADVFRRHLAIPMSANLTDSQIDRVVDAVVEAVAAERR